MLTSIELALANFRGIRIPQVCDVELIEICSERTTPRELHSRLSAGGRHLARTGSAERRRPSSEFQEPLRELIRVGPIIIIPRSA